ncbi:hypothetical protein CR513_07055, partial [Mucuna pruriens]
MKVVAISFLVRDEDLQKHQPSSKYLCKEFVILLIDRLWSSTASPLVIREGALFKVWLVSGQ